MDYLTLVVALAGLVQCHPTFDMSRRQYSNNTASTFAAAASSSIPSYVYTYAPLVWLDSQATYFPADIGAQVRNTHPVINQSTTTIPNVPSPLTLNNLASLNAYGDGGKDVYLASGYSPTDYLSWFAGVKPNSNGATVGATSCAIIVVPKANDILDAFYFYFFAFNQGNQVLSQPELEFGDHVGDWEHNMIRFNSSTGQPQAIWYSQHTTGEAFTYNAVQKLTSSPLRPVSYSALGSHANYAVAGTIDHTIPGLNLPFGPIEDHTSAGTLWDPIQSAYHYIYDVSSNTFTSPNGDPTSWLQFQGQWGDDTLPKSTPGQIELFGQYKYDAGPTGPIDKDLGRTNVCLGSGSCIIRPILTD